MAQRFPKPVTVEEFERMIEAGDFPDELKVELLEGEIVEKMAPGERHADCVRALINLFRFRAPADVEIDVQNPAWMALDSLPQPDLFLMRKRPPGQRGRPHPEEVVLIVEVCDSSLSLDRRVKVPLYARAGVPEVWLIDLRGRRVLRFRDPQPAPAGGWVKGGHAPAWGHEDVVTRGAALAPAACPDARLTVDEILGEDTSAG